MTEAGRGVLAMVGACVIWGLSPLFYKLLADVPPLEVLSHRTLWSLATFAVVLALQGRLGAVRVAVATPRKAALMAFAALMISANWFLFIFSVQVGRVAEAALGYYIFPLAAVLVGFVLLGERLGRLQWLAVGLAALAVTVLTLGLGVAPWISLILAVTFATYGVLKRRVDAGPVVSVTAEVMLLAPLAAAIVLFAGTGAFTGSARDAALLILSGPLTATPLILFSYATKRAAMSTVGLVQYLNPTLQFLCAVVIFGEVVTRWHAIAFPMIWVGLAMYSWGTLRSARAATPT